MVYSKILINEYSWDREFIYRGFTVHRIFAFGDFNFLLSSPSYSYFFLFSKCSCTLKSFCFEGAISLLGPRITSWERHGHKKEDPITLFWQ